MPSLCQAACSISISIRIPAAALAPICVCIKAEAVPQQQIGNPRQNPMFDGPQEDLCGIEALCRQANKGACGTDGSQRVIQQSKIPIWSSPEATLLQSVTLAGSW